MKKRKTKIQHNMCGHPYTYANTNNVNLTSALQHTTGGQDEQHIVFYVEIVTDITR